MCSQEAMLLLFPFLLENSLHSVPKVYILLFSVP
jgi:hypothetical protein